MTVEDELRQAMTELAETQPVAPGLSGRVRAGVRRSRLRRAVPLVAAAVALVVGWQVLGPADGPVSVPVTAPAVGADGPDCAALLAEGPPVPGTVPLPGGVRVTGLVQCREAAPGRDEAEVKRATSGLQPLVDALTSGDAWSLPWRKCDADVSQVNLGQLWVRIEGGQWLKPRLPIGPCGLPQEEIASALARLHFDSTSSVALGRPFTYAEPTCEPPTGIDAGMMLVRWTPLPPTKAVTAAVLCRSERGSGPWIIVKRRATDVAALAAALRRPNDHDPLPPGVSCDGPVWTGGDLYVRLADGTWIHPALPTSTSTCSVVQPAVVSALAATPFTVVARLPFRQ